MSTKTVVCLCLGIALFGIGLMLSSGKDSLAREVGYFLGINAGGILIGFRLPRGG